MAKYRLTNEAIRDLDEIWSFTYEKWSVDQADRYYNLIIDEIEYIASNPLLEDPWIILKKDTDYLR